MSNVILTVAKSWGNQFRLGVRPQFMNEPLVGNGFGKSWLGCLVKKLGADPKTVYCRGEWQEHIWVHRADIV